MITHLVAPLTGLFLILYAAWRGRQIEQKETGTPQMEAVARKIAQGARSFLWIEYRYILLFSLGISGGLFLLQRFYPMPDGSSWTGVTFLCGALASAVAGFLSMRIATMANVRTAHAARQDVREAFSISFGGGMVMACGIIGIALGGLGLIFLAGAMGRHSMPELLEVLTGFSLGTESVALFARVAGGIYTKAADVGADIVGKVEASIPEDDPRNPATIADNVGDNVGDVAGMGADLLGSFVATVLAAMVLGAKIAVSPPDGDLAEMGEWQQAIYVMLPLLVVSCGAIASLLASMVVRLGDRDQTIERKLHLGNLIAVLLTALGSYVVLTRYLGDSNPTVMLAGGQISLTSHKVWASVVTGMGTGLIVSYLTSYFTSKGRAPVSMIVRHSGRGPATNVIAGLSVGMYSTVLPVLCLAGALCVSYQLGGFYGVAMASVGMMSTTPIQLAIDGFGPIADNAGGIAQMAHLPEEVRQRTDVLDAVGNTTAAMGKGFAIGSAALTSCALFAAFLSSAKITSVGLENPKVLAGLLTGGTLPFLFSALAIQAVGSAAGEMVEEVRRQFRTIPGLLEGQATPDYHRCISIVTYAAIRHMVLPVACSIGMPLAVGFLGGAEMLAAFFVGVIVTGLFLAFFQCNAGGAWDNAKKAFEEGVEIGGTLWRKGSDAHKAAVVGDTVGDPLKDTSGPSMNILIKLTGIVCLMLAPYVH